MRVLQANLRSPRGLRRAAEVLVVGHYRAWMGLGLFMFVFFHAFATLFTGLAVLQYVETEQGCKRFTML